MFHAVGDIRLEDVPSPQLKEQPDAIVRLTSSTVSGTDLYSFRGTSSDLEPDRILGHEGASVGLVKSIGEIARNIAVENHVIIPSTIGCGFCSYFREGYFA